MQYISKDEHPHMKLQIQIHDFFGNVILHTHNTACERTAARNTWTISFHFLLAQHKKKNKLLKIQQKTNIECVFIYNGYWEK